MLVKQSLSKFFTFILFWQVFFNDVNSVRIPPQLFWPLFIVLLLLYWIGLDKRGIFVPKTLALFFVGLLYIIISGVFAGTGDARSACFYSFKLALYVFSIVLAANLILFQQDWMTSISKMVFSISLIHAGFVYLEFLFPSIFFFSIAFQNEQYFSIAREFMQIGAYVGLNSQSSVTAMLLVVGLVFSLYLFYVHRNSLIKWTVLIGQAVLVSSVFLTQRRLSAGLACIVLAYEFLFLFNAKMKSASISLFFFLLVVFGWDSIPGLESVLEKFEIYASQGNMTSGRIRLWIQALSLLHGSPLLGSGWGAYLIKFGGSSAHNSFLQILGELGIIGFILYFSYHVFCLYLAIRLFFLKDFDPGLKAVIVCFMVFWYVSSFFEAYFYATESLIFLFLIEFIVQFEWNSRKKAISIPVLQGKQNQIGEVVNAER